MAAFLPNLFVTNEGIIMKRTIVMIVMIATLFTGMIFFSYAQRQQAVELINLILLGNMELQSMQTQVKFCMENAKTELLSG